MEHCSPCWEKIAELDLSTSCELIKHVSELHMAVHAMTAQVLKMRGEGDIADLKAEAEQIKAEAAERTKIFRMMMKASEEGIDARQCQGRARHGRQQN